MKEGQKTTLVLGGLLGVLLGVWILLWMISPNEYAPGAYKTAAPVRAAAARGLRYQDDGDWKVGKYGNVYIAGTVKNESEKTYRYAAISFNILDKKGNQIGNAYANATGLDPGRTWKFEAIVHKRDGIHTFEFQEIKGW